MDLELVCEGFEQHLRRPWPEYLNFPIAMSVPPTCEASPAISVASQSLQDAEELHQATFEEMLPQDWTSPLPPVQRSLSWRAVRGLVALEGAS